MMHTKVNTKTGAHLTKTEQNFYPWICANWPLRNRGQNNCVHPDWVAKACFTRVPGGGERGTPYNGLLGEAPPERGTFSRPQIYERVAILLVEAYESVGKSVIWVCERAYKC